MGVRQRDLIDGEKVVVEIRSSARSLRGPIVACGVVGALGVLSIDRLQGMQRSFAVDAALGFLVLLGIWGTARWLRWHSRVIAVTTERVLLVEGVFRRQSDQVRLARIVEVHVRQGAIARLFSRGSVIIELDDAPPVAIENIRRPDALARLLLRAIRPPLDDVRHLERLPVIVGDGDPTPPRGTPAVSVSSAAEALVRRDEIDRLEASGVLTPSEAARRRAQLGWAGHEQ